MKHAILLLLCISSGLMASEGAELYRQCVACHGLNGEKKALDRSEVIAGWDSPRTETALKAYRAGTRNTKGMGTLMKSKVAAYSDEEIDAVAAYIASLKQQR